MPNIIKSGSSHATLNQVSHAGGTKNLASISNKATVAADTQIDSNGVDANGVVSFRFGNSPVLYHTAVANVTTQ